MSYDKFRKRRWKVNRGGGLAQCKPGDAVNFDGPPESVIVSCQNTKPYGEGTYRGDSHTIVRANEYTISMDEPQRTIAFTPAGGSVAGSWTAEDNGPWQDDG